LGKCPRRVSAARNSHFQIHRATRFAVCCVGAVRPLAVCALHSSPSGSQPKSRVIIPLTLFTIMPPPTSSMTASAVCTITSEDPKRARRLDWPPRPPERSSSVPPRAARQAGVRPKASALRSVMPAVKPSTPPSSERSKTGGISSGSPATMRRLPHTAIIHPSTPPIAAMTRLSVRSCRRIRPRPAPSAERTASSALRESARARSRLATFTHAIRRTKPTTTVRRIEACTAMSPATSSRSVFTSAVQPSLVSGCSSCSCRLTSMTA